MKRHNFYSGPALLAPSVFQKASEALIEFNNSGLSIIEISHRSDAFLQIIERSKTLLRELMNIPDSHDICFMMAGGSHHFVLAPMNLMKTNAAYLDTGVWANKAISEAEQFGRVNVVASSREKNYSFIPKHFEVPHDADYFHITSNNTIYGTQHKEFPKISTTLVCDMSSDILSRKTDVALFKLIYAGAQKNLGTAGCSIVIADRTIFNKTGKRIPNIFNYETHFENNSLYNTPPVFAIYVCMLTLEWLQEQGGVPVIEKKNQFKAKLLYDAIDNSSLFYGTVDKNDRSLMNVCFRLHNASLEERFLNLCKQAGIEGIKGHRIAGGFRASIYNAMPVESVQVLVDTIRHFDKTHS